MTNLLIDIGNTALKAAWADGMTLGKTFRYQGEHLYEYISGLTSKIRPDIMVLSTVRDISRHYDDLRKTCGTLVILDSNHTGESVSRGIPPYLTPDRAASIIAVRYLFKGRGCTLFDFGTTLTADFLDTEGRYTGGCISIGCRTRFRAVNRYTRVIPLYDTPELIPDKVTSLKSSVETGIINGMCYEIEGYIGRFPENTIVFTGGDAIYFAKRMKNSIFVVCNLVLMGLALIAEEYVENI